MIALRKVRIVDSHTAGEPTRVVIAGGPDLGGGSLDSQREVFRRVHDGFRSAVLNEPRGYPAMVGALLCPPKEGAAVGVVFFNNVGFLGMCGHGIIGVVATLSYLGRIAPGIHTLDTPVGRVSAVLHDSHEVSFTNVPSFRYLTQTTLEVPGHGRVVGDVAWGGNWFFLTEDAPAPIELVNLDALTEFAWRTRQALAGAGITGTGGAEIDHVELAGPPKRSEASGRNFVLCPGKAYDRSPCGTGTSAKMACLYADGKLREGEVWRQEGILGTMFEGRIAIRDGQVYPTIRGSAFITGDGELVWDPEDLLNRGAER